MCVYSEHGICTGEAASWAVCDQYSNGSVSRASESSGTMFFRTACSWMLSMPLSTFSLLFSIRSIHLFFSNRPLLTFTGHLSFFSSHKSHLALQSCVFFQPLLAPRDMFFHVFLFFSFPSEFVESFQMVETGNAEKERNGELRSATIHLASLSESCWLCRKYWVPACSFVCIKG